MTFIFVGFVLLAALLLWFLIGARGLWWVKLAVTVLVLSFSFLVWHAIGTGAGYPTSAAPSTDSAFVGCLVEQPDARTGAKGVIYLWLIPLHSNAGVLDYHPATGEPRAYRLPYSEALYQACITASKAAGQGSAVGLHVGKGHKSHGRYIPGVYRPYVLPSPKPPSKGAP